MKSRWAICLFYVVLLNLSVSGQVPVKPDSIVGYKRRVDGVDLQTQHGTLQIRLCDHRAAHSTRPYSSARARRLHQLYEDDVETYAYEKGAYSTIDLNWNDATGTLTLGERKGAFTGVLKQRMFRWSLSG